MNLLFGLYAISAIITLFLAWRSRNWPTVGLYALFLLVGYVSYVELLSRPKPVTVEWFLDSVDEVVVLGATAVEGEAIYVWLQIPGVDEPRAYKLDWNRKTAEQMQAANRAAEKSGTAVKMRMPFERSLDDREPMFYALPQPALPPKEVS